jgi:peptide/nickel transport system substrate-binding protein
MTIFTLCGTSSASADVDVVVDQPPATLNPRLTLDASGQRISSLLFASLTRVGPSLELLPDLARSWSASADHKVWRFEIEPGRVDHSGRALSADELARCFRSYAGESPESRAVAIQSLTGWTRLKAKGSTLTFELSQPDPHFARNSSLLRYFRSDGENLEAQAPCSEPAPGSRLITSGGFRADTRDFENGLKLERRSAGGAFEPAGSIRFVRDEMTRTLQLLRGAITVAQNSFSPVRTRWLHEHHPERFALLETPGVNVSYLAFNLRDPALADVRVRRALAMAIPVDAIIRHKLAGMADPATSFIAPFLPEAHAPARLPNDLPAAQALLDEAGHPRDLKSGIRKTLKLSFKTTPVRDGYEIVRVIQDAWKRIGVELELEVVEPAVFLASVRKGAFQLSLGRWVGVADSSILERTLRSGHASNRSGYASAEADSWIDRMNSGPSTTARRQAAQALQELMLKDLPYFPLWFWRNALLHDRKLAGLEARNLSRSGALAPLFELRPVEGAAP